MSLLACQEINKKLTLCTQILPLISCSSVQFWKRSQGTIALTMSQWGFYATQMIAPRSEEYLCLVTVQEGKPTQGITQISLNDLFILNMVMSWTSFKYGKDWVYEETCSKSLLSQRNQQTMQHDKRSQDNLSLPCLLSLQELLVDLQVPQLFHHQFVLKHRNRIMLILAEL